MNKIKGTIITLFSKKILKNKIVSIPKHQTTIKFNRLLTLLIYTSRVPVNKLVHKLFLKDVFSRQPKEGLELLIDLKDEGHSSYPGFLYLFGWRD